MNNNRKPKFVDFDDEEILPVNKPIEEIPYFENEEETKRFSVVESKWEKLTEKFIEKPKRMESIKSSIISSSSDFSNCDKISERLAEIIIIKEEKDHVEEIAEIKRRGHRKNALTIHRVLPISNEINNYLSARSPPEEEFFLMTLMWYKLNHQHFGKICDINGQKLYIKASKDLMLPFYKFPDFIEKELDSAYLNLIYLKRKKRHLQKPTKALTPLQQAQRLRVKQAAQNEQRGKIYDDEYEFDDDYF